MASQGSVSKARQLRNTIMRFMAYATTQLTLQGITVAWPDRLKVKGQPGKRWDRYSLDQHSSGLISQSKTCAAIYAKFQCVHRTSARVTSDAGVGYQHEAPCNDTGVRMLPCYQWCAEYMTVCIPTMPLKYVTDLCTMYSAPRTDACFGSNGRLGMLPPWKEATDSGAHSPQAPSWVGMLAIAVMHYLLH